MGNENKSLFHGGSVLFRASTHPCTRVAGMERGVPRVYQEGCIWGICGYVYGYAVKSRVWPFKNSKSVKAVLKRCHCARKVKGAVSVAVSLSVCGVTSGVTSGVTCGVTCGVYRVWPFTAVFYISLCVSGVLSFYA